MTVACTDLTNASDLPAGTSDPASYRTPAGALAMSRQGIAWFQIAWERVAVSSGVFTDELIDPTSGGEADRRTLPLDIEPGVGSGALGGGPYWYLQRARGQASLAASALLAYGGNDPSTPPQARAEMYALEGYTEVLLADVFCSGIPLSTTDFDRNFTYRAGASTGTVYRHAIALFDTAMTLSGDSMRMLNVARIGRGRAWLSLGQYDSAARAVQGVPTNYRYQFMWMDTTSDGFHGTSVWDREGTNGLPYRSEGDPRTAAPQVGPLASALPYYYPNKYLPETTPTPRVVADGVEARLIEAEAKLYANDLTGWLTILNTLRTTCSDAATCANPAPAGTGGFAGLAPLADPGSDSARVSLMFHERAYWLFLTGHRLSDMRRLVRQYHRRPQDVFPVGTAPGAIGHYGTDVHFPIPTRAESPNPLFTGCIDRNA